MDLGGALHGVLGAVHKIGHQDVPRRRLQRRGNHQKVGNDREIQNISGSDYTIKNKDFELTVGVDRNAVEDDKIGLYRPSIQMLGEAAGREPSPGSAPCCFYSPSSWPGPFCMPRCSVQR